LTPRREARTRSAKACWPSRVRYPNNTFRVDNVVRHGNDAVVHATRTNPGTTRTAIHGATVEDNT
jgi:hypothetical protein